MAHVVIEAHTQAECQARTGARVDAVRRRRSVDTRRYGRARCGGRLERGAERQAAPQTDGVAADRVGAQVGEHGLVRAADLAAVESLARLVLFDRADLSLAKEDVLAVNNMKKAGIPVVVIVISGRPVLVNDILPQADALIAAFLPGTEGQGVADVLFGDYKPTGKLSFSWPKSNDQLPLNINMPKDKYDPLFKFGYGLSY